MTSCAGLCYLCLVIVAHWRNLECSSYVNPLMATKEGDIIIGGIFPVHESVNFSLKDDGRPPDRTCTRYTTERLLQVLMLVEAVEAVNRSPLLGNLTLGYRILDSCSDVSTAVVLTREYLDMDFCPSEAWNRTGQNKTMPAGPLRPVKVVIGGYHSEISIAVARQLSIHQIPQISYGSTTGILSDKSRFPAFMRTVPEDNYQAQAIVELLIHEGWTWVGVVTTDGDYGRYAAQRFQEHARKKGICIAFSEVLSDILDDEERLQVINKTIQNIEKDPRIGVIVSFAKPDHMMYVMQMLTPNATRRVWIASDNWATSRRVIETRNLSDIGTVIGVTLKSGNMSHFERFLEGLDPDPAAHEHNAILRQYLWEQGKGLRQPELGEELKKKIYPYAVFSVGLAVRAIARAVADLCADTDDCRNKTIEPWQLLHALRKATFKWEPDLYKFDKHGDLNTGYDVILWKQKGDHVDMRNVVATYSIESQDLSYENGVNITGLVGNMTSRCSISLSCVQGERKVIPQDKQVCCFECEKCQNNTFSNVTNAEHCQKCKDDQWSREGSTGCMDKKKMFFGWQNNFAIVLLSFATLGVVLTLVVLVLFLTYWSTPVVKASVGPISLLLLISLLGTFTSAVLFAGKPNNHQCQARQVLFGLSFTLCISCILVKSFKILLAFQINPSLRLILDKPYQSYIIIAACVAVQVAICTAWLTLKQPFAEENELGHDQIVVECNEGSFLYFGLMLGYIGLLSLIGFIIAFKGRKLPDGYNEAKCITFGLLIYLFCWVLFGPIYAHSRAGIYLPAVEMIVILFSAYGIFGTLFVNKCYVILFRKERNTREAFRQNVMDYTHRTSLEHSDISLSSSPHSSLHGSSSQASLVPRNVSDGHISSIAGDPSTHLTTNQPSAEAQRVFTDENRTKPVNRSKKALTRCATVH